MWVSALTRVLSLSEGSHCAVATGLVGNAVLRGGPATLDIVFVPEGRPPLIAYFVMTLLTNIGTTREYYTFSERAKLVAYLVVFLAQSFCSVVCGGTTGGQRNTSLKTSATPLLGE